MNRNREVLKHCPHFYTIINFDYYSDDIVSEKLIEIYERYIFSVDISVLENVSKIEKLDTVLYKYISDFAFRDEIKKDIVNVKFQHNSNILDAFVNAIIGMFENYEKMKLRRVPVTRWI